MTRTHLLAAALVISAAPSFAAGPIQFIKGNASIFKGDASFLVEMDFTTTAIDGYDTEEAFVEGNRKKEKDPEKWENGWKKDKAGFLNAYTLSMAGQMKKTKLKFSNDDPDSKYKMIVRPTKIKTGTPVRYSSVEMKISVIDMATQEEVAVIFVPEINGVQWQMTIPTMGMTVNYAIIYSSRALGKYILKTLK